MDCSKLEEYILHLKSPILHLIVVQKEMSIVLLGSLNFSREAENVDFCV